MSFSSVAALLVAAALQSHGTAPATTEPWVPKAVSSPMWESHPAFDPITGDLYFVRGTKDFKNWRLLVSHCTSDGWAEPQDPAFAAKGTEADPFFTDGGNRLFYISSRKTGTMNSADLDIWQVKRGTDGAWGTPERLPEPVNSDAAEWFPRVAADGWLYFGSNRAEGFGGNDIWRARETGPGQWHVENAGEAFNTAGQDYEAEPSPDGKHMLIATGDGYYETVLKNGIWQPRTKLGATLNVNGTEIGALYSPSGNSILFSRDAGAPWSGEFFVLRTGKREAWPPSCPATMPAQ